MNYGVDEFRLLSKEDIFNAKGKVKLDVIEKFGVRAAITDFAILLGGEVNKNTYVPYDDTLKGRTCCWYLSSPSRGGGIEAVEEDGFNDGLDFKPCNRSIGIRPVFSYTNIPFYFKTRKIKRNIYELEHGEYPQYAVDSKLADVLEKEYSKQTLKKTGKTYTVDSCYVYDEENPFAPKKYEEYEYNDKKFIRVKGNCGFFKTTLSNGETIISDDNVWVEVSPLTWYIDTKAKMIISKNCIAAGVRVCDDKRYNGDFKNTEMYTFLNSFLLKDIVPIQIQKGIQQVNQNVTTKQDIKKILNPYSFNFDEVNEEEIIKGAVESNVPVFLHGRSSEGKSARIKELDSDCEIIYMRNATPDSLNGKSVYNQETGEMIDIKPSWLVKLEEKCKKEPDKIHIVFFDELTNALPSIQGMAFNIVLDREVNGKWSLPKNARIAAAGNDMEDSLAANQMAEPLFNRFAHVYIETTPETWLKWAITPVEDYKRLDYKEEKPPLKIHPAIYTYIAFTNGNALRSEYTGDKPNADPRKWEMASKMLYKTGNPQMLRALVGEDITKEFIEFCNQPVISLYDVINDNYTTEDVMLLNTSARYSTMLGLTRAQEKDMTKVRKFVMKLGPEFEAIFDALWTHGDERRLELVAEEKLMEQGMGGLNNGR